MKRNYILVLIANVFFLTDIFCQTDRTLSEIRGIFDINGFTVVSEDETDFLKLFITKDSDSLIVYHYSSPVAAAAAKHAIETAVEPEPVFIDSRNIYWGTTTARNIYEHGIDIYGLPAKNPGYANLLHAIRIANNTIWKYTDFDEWKNTRVLNPRPYYNIHTYETEGESNNLYEYTNIIEMLLMAMKSLQIIKDMPEENEIYSQLFNYYEQLLWDASTISLDFYKGFAVVTSTTQANVRWENIYGVPRQTTINPENYDVSGIQNVYDDQMWLIRCFLEIYFILEKEAENLTGAELETNRERSKWYLEVAEYLTLYCLDGWDQSKRQDGREWGGIPWGPGYATKHTCSNSPFISPLVWLAEIYKNSDETIEHLVRGDYNTNTVTAETTLKNEYYLDYAVRLYDFVYNTFRRSDNVYGDMIGVSTNIPETGPNAGLKTTNAHGRLDPTAYSYNSGSTLSGVADLYRVITDGEKKSGYRAQIAALSESSFRFFADPNIKSGYFVFPQNTTGKADFDACLLRAWVEVYKHDIFNTYRFIDAFSTTLNFGFRRYFHNGFLPLDHLFGWEPHENEADVKVSSLRTFGYSAQFSWISLAEFFRARN